MHERLKHREELLTARRDLQRAESDLKTAIDAAHARAAEHAPTPEDPQLVEEIQRHLKTLEGKDAFLQNDEAAFEYANASGVPPYTTSWWDQVRDFRSGKSLDGIRTRLSELQRARDSRKQRQRDAWANEQCEQQKTAFEVARNRLELAVKAAESDFAKAISSDYFATIESDFSEPGANDQLDRLSTIRVNHVQRWCADQFGAQVSDEQAQAIGAPQCNTLLTARAGAGKTRTLTLRAAFLIRHCKVNPKSILIVAFNRAAAEEVRARLEAYGLQCPHVMTFHALAYAIVRPEQSLAGSDDDHRGVLQRVINNCLRDGQLARTIGDLLLRHFRTDWDAILSSGVAMSAIDGLMLRRSLERETLDGLRVKSRGEKLIANLLFEHGISYQYERNHWWGNRNYRPDFTLPHHKVVIEFFGIHGDSEYDQLRQDKRQYWRMNTDWRYIEIEADELSRGVPDFERAVAKRLTSLDIKMVRLDEQEIWQKLESRIRTRSAEVLRSIVGRCRKAMLDPDQFDIRRGRHPWIDELERDVLEMASIVYRRYLEHLSQEGLEDFDGLIVRALEHLRSGKTGFEGKWGTGDVSQTSHLLVDEFQDMSKLFNALLQGIKNVTGQPGGATIFGVGDAWQAINGFAGSELEYFENFGTHHANSRELAITTNYRSSKAVIGLGNAVMSGHGASARAAESASVGEVMVADIAGFKPTPEEQEYWPSDLLTAAVRRLIRDPISNGKSVALLARQRYLPFPISDPKSPIRADDDLKSLELLVRSGLSDAQALQVCADTAHGYKGREADVVIVLDAIDGRFPKIHPDWVFGRIFGDSLESVSDAERRLFYVACSRARERLILLTDSDRVSPMLEGVRAKTTAVNWNKLRSFCPPDGHWIMLVRETSDYRSGGTALLAQELKARGFRWDGTFWRKAIERSRTIEHLVERIPRATWFAHGQRLQIQIRRSDGEVAADMIATGGKLWDASSRH